MTQTKQIIIALLAAALIIAGCMMWVDRPITAYLQALDRERPDIIAPFKVITDLGKSVWYLPPLGIYAGVAFLLAWRGKKQWLARGQIAAFIFANVAVSGLAVDLMKILVGRSRPVLLARHDIFNQFSLVVFDSQSWSFPSGHSATVMSLALAVSAIFPRWRAALLVFAGVVASTRVIVAAHYPSDMIAGIAFAVMVYLALTALFRARRWDGWIEPPK
ncbi:MAG: phosphatase PAP2 family protein [Alphaproteobacteria bacterium]